MAGRMLGRSERGGKPCDGAPLSTEANANWARDVLTKQYPGRAYEVNCYPLAKPVEASQLTTFESWAMDEVKRLELAQRQAG